MDIFSAILLGVVQGVTEFLPVSSSGHLILMRTFLGVGGDGSLAFDAVLQLATTLAVILYFWRDIFDIFSVRNARNNILLFAVALGSVPAVLVGVFFEKNIEGIFRNAHFVAWALIAGSILFFVAERYAKKRELSLDVTKGPKEISVKNGFWIGVFQVLAFIPGMSRSGSTISGGLLLGLKRGDAVRFSFLLSVPILFGSGAKKLLDLGSTHSIDASLIIGSVVAFVVGLASIHFLIVYLRKHTLNVFIVYRILLALVIFWWL